MTNAEKYLKDENYKKTLWYDFKDWYNNTKINCPYGIAFEEFMDSSVKPQLTEDERVILRNIQSPFKWIRRTSSGELQISDTEGLERTQWIIQLSCFPHLFQFIKERRRI